MGSNTRPTQDVDKTCSLPWDPSTPDQQQHTACTRDSALWLRACCGRQALHQRTVHCSLPIGKRHAVDTSVIRWESLCSPGLVNTRCELWIDNENELDGASARRTVQERVPLGAAPPDDLLRQLSRAPCRRYRLRLRCLTRSGRHRNQTLRVALAQWSKDWRCTELGCVVLRVQHRCSSIATRITSSVGVHADSKDVVQVQPTVRSTCTQVTQRRSSRTHTTQCHSHTTRTHAHSPHATLPDIPPFLLALSQVFTGC